MSHFSVLVVGNNVEEQLAPFIEQVKADSPYAVFKDEHEKNLKDYETKSTEKVILEDGTYASPWEKRFEVEGDSPLSRKYVIPENLVKKQIPFKELYSSFEEYMEDWCGQGKETVHPETKHYGYWHNPSAKWDWWILGGRWQGFFQLKKDSEGNFIKEAQLGESGVFGPTRNAVLGRADRAYKKDIDFEAMRNQEEAEARKLYQKVASFFGGSIPKIDSWDKIREQVGTENIEEARTKYNSQSAIAKLRSSEDKELFWVDLEDFQISEEEYAQKARKTAICTFAFLMEGKWSERGDMGWWGCVSDEKDRVEWATGFENFIESLPDDTILNIVDCHI